MGPQINPICDPRVIELHGINSLAVRSLILLKIIHNIICNPVSQKRPSSVGREEVTWHSSGITCFCNCDQTIAMITDDHNHSYSQSRSTRDKSQCYDLWLMVLKSIEIRSSSGLDACLQLSFDRDIEFIFMMNELGWAGGLFAYRVLDVTAILSDLWHL